MSTESSHAEKGARGGGLSWSAFEYENREKTPDWFWAIGIIAASLAIISLIGKNVLFAFFIVLGTAVFFIYAIKKPRMVEITLDESGIRADDMSIPYASLESFGIVENDGDVSLILKSSETLRQHIALPIVSVTSESVRAFLKHYLPEEELREPVSHTFSRFIGF